MSEDKAKDESDEKSEERDRERDRRSEDRRKCGPTKTASPQKEKGGSSVFKVIGSTGNYP